MATDSSFHFLSELLGESTESFDLPVDEFGRIISQNESIDAEGTHFIVGKELRTLGVGFFKFSQDEFLRAQQQQDLSIIRSKTESERSNWERRVQTLRERRDRRLSDYTCTLSD